MRDEAADDDSGSGLIAMPFEPSTAHRVCHCQHVTRIEKKLDRIDARIDALVVDMKRIEWFAKACLLGIVAAMAGTVWSASLRTQRLPDPPAMSNPAERMGADHIPAP